MDGSGFINGVACDMVKDIGTSPKKRKRYKVMFLMRFLCPFLMCTE